LKGKRISPLTTMNALVSSAFGEVENLENLKVAHKAIAGAGFEPATFGL